MLNRVFHSSWVFCISARGRDLHDSARNLQLRLAVSVFVSALFTSAFVVAQVPRTGTLPDGSTTQKTFQEKVAKTPDKREDGGQDVKLKASMVKRPVREAQAKKKGEDALAANRQRAIQLSVTKGSPFVRAELIFVRHICPMSQETFRQISRDANDVLKEVVTQWVDARPKRAVPIDLSTPEAPDAAKPLQDGLAAVMKKHLSPAQWTIYQAELDKRKASQKATAVRYLVETLDRALCLSDQQRARLTDSLSAQWDDGWIRYLESMLQGNQYYPMSMIPVVRPLLSNAQRDVLHGFEIRRLAGVFGVNVGGFAQDNDALEEELGEARKARPRNAEMENQLIMDARMLELGAPRAAQVKQLLEMRKADMGKIESKKAVTKKPGAN